MNKPCVSFVKENFIAVISTQDNLRPYASPVYYYFSEDENTFYFITNSTTKKYSNIREKNQVSLTIFSEHPPRVFTANCTAQLSDFETSDKTDIKNKLVEIHSSQEFYPSPISSLEKGKISLVKLNAKNCKLKSFKQRH